MNIHVLPSIIMLSVTGEMQQLDPDPNPDVNLTDCNIKCSHALKVPYY